MAVCTGVCDAPVDQVHVQVNEGGGGGAVEPVDELSDQCAIIRGDLEMSYGARHSVWVN